MRTTMGVILAAAALVAGCGSDDSNGGNDTSAPDTSINTDTSVGVDTNTDTTVPDPNDTNPPNSSFDCSTDADCTGGAICSCEGVCVVPQGAACETDLNCGIPNWCNPCTGYCEEQADICGECTLSRGCKDDGECVPFTDGGNRCSLACISNAGCPIGFNCVDLPSAPSRQCIPASGSCIELGLCEDDGDCPDAQVCNEGNKQCGQGCSEDGGCPNGQVCVLGRCNPPCSGDADCVAPAVCEDNGHCRIPGSCGSSSECPEPETYCNTLSGMCTPGCLVDADCKDASLECVSQSCQPKGCEHNYQCAFGEVCDKGTGDCVMAAGDHCSTCEEGDPIACDEPSLCAEFQDEDENPLGKFCLRPCIDDPIDKCPQGYQCTEVMMEGGPSTFVCARQCYYDPVGGSSE